MKNFSKIGSILLCFLLLVVMLCGCGEVAKGTEYGNTDFSYYASTADSDSAPAEAGKTKSVAENRKIIEYYYFTIETKTFDALLKQIEETVSNSGGYIESSEIDGSSYEYRTENRNATLKIRIPKTKQTDFSEFLDANANVVSRSVNTEDVTEQYIDTESRIKALTLEKNLGKAADEIGRPFRYIGGI